jgi:hypothetical protein
MCAAQFDGFRVRVVQRPLEVESVFGDGYIERICAVVNAERAIGKPAWAWKFEGTHNVRCVHPIVRFSHGRIRACSDGE